jgi:coat protein Gp5
VANLFQVVDWITMESLRTLLNRLVVAEFFNTDYNKEFTREFAVGETVRVKNPQRFTIRDGIGYTPQPIARNYTTVSCDQIFGIDFEWDSAEAALKAERGMDNIRREYIVPAMEQIAQEIDSRAANWAYLNTNNIVGTLGTNATTTAIAGAARQRLIENACPPGDYRFIISPGHMTSIVDGGTTLFNDRGEISKAFKEGYYGRARQFDWFESMSLYSHTAGTWGANTTEIDGAGQSGNSLLLSATTGDVFRKGDVFNIEGVYNVNPKTRRSTGVLKQFVITQEVTAAASAATINFIPAIIGPGSQYQNVSALPANDADLTLFPGTTTPSTGPKAGIQGLALAKDAFALVGVKLETPKAVEVSSQTRDPKTGLSVRFVRMFDPIQSKMVNRFDVLLGFGNLYADQCAVRVLGA